MTESERCNRTMWSAWLPAVALAFLALLQLISYVYLIPPWQGPDEPRHFEYVALLARQINLTEPAGLDLQAEIIASMVQHRFWDRGYFIKPYDPQNPPRTLDDIWPGFAHETHQPPIYYYMAAGLLRAFGPEDVTSQLLLVRFLSVALGAGVVLVAWFTARELFPRATGLALGIALFIALLPMHTFINATVNNDNLIALFVSLQLFFTVRIIRRGLRPLDGIAVLLLTGLALGTKRTGFIAPAIALVALVAGLWDRLAGIVRRWGTRRTSIVIVGVVAVFTLGGVALWLGGRATLSRLWVAFRLPPDVLQLLSDGSYVRALQQTPYPYYTRMVFESFWARFGWLNIRLADAWYVALAGACLLAIAGLCLLFTRAVRKQTVWQLFQIHTLIVFVVVVVLAIALILIKEIAFLSYQFGVVPQGRYLFPVIIALATLFVVGCREIAPVRWRRWIGPIAALLLFAFNIVCVHWYIIPHYYGG